MPRTTRKACSSQSGRSGRKPGAVATTELFSEPTEDALEAIDELARILARQAARQFVSKGAA